MALTNAQRARLSRSFSIHISQHDNDAEGVYISVVKSEWHPFQGSHSVALVTRYSYTEDLPGVVDELLGIVRGLDAANAMERAQL